LWIYFTSTLESAISSLKTREGSSSRRKRRKHLSHDLKIQFGFINLKTFYQKNKHIENKYAHIYMHTHFNINKRLYIPHFVNQCLIDESIFQLTYKVDASEMKIRNQI